MRKRLLTVMITALAMLMLVACGDSKEVSSDSAKEKKEKVESEVEKDNVKEDKTNQEYSGDGGAPVEGEETGTNTEPDTEVVEPVATTFTLVDENGTVIFEGDIPAGLTLVDGNGTSHIEFAYAENPDVSVCLDAGLDYDVLAAVKCNTRIWHGNSATPQDLINNIDEYIAANNVPEDALTITDEMPYKPIETTESINANGTNNYMYMAMLNNYIGYHTATSNHDMAGKFFVPRYDEYGLVKNYITVEEPDTSEYGYLVLKATSVKTDAGFSESPFTVTLIVDQPDVTTLTLEEIELTYYFGNRGYVDYDGSYIVKLFTDVIKSFSN